MRDYDEIYKEIVQLSNYDKEMLLTSIFIEFQIAEQWGMSYIPQRFFEATLSETIKKHRKRSHGHAISL